MFRTTSLLVLTLAAATPALAAPAKGLPPQAAPAAQASAGGALVLDDLTLTEHGDGSYALGIVIAINGTKEAKDPPLTAELAGNPTVVLTTIEGRELEVVPGELERRGAVRIVTGEAPKGGVATLTLVDGAGKPVWKGSARLGGGVLRGRWDGDYADGKNPGTWTVEAPQLHPTREKGVFDLSFGLVGDGSLTIAGGSVVFTDSATLKTVSSTTFVTSGFEATRTFTTDVRFDGDPVGGVYDFVVAVTDRNGATTTTATALEVVQLPGEGGAPGPILSVSANGSGTRNASSNTQQTQQAQLL